MFALLFVPNQERKPPHPKDREGKETNWGFIFFESSGTAQDPISRVERRALC
jgi:hypothetical protein